MKLDRNNYEEFFLLYVDNELTAAQKKSVEQFIQENPDLAMELEILQQTVVAADDSVVFTGKDALLKKESGSLINMSNYEEYLISYIDDELNTAERKAFETFAASHPQVKEELSVYMQTKLHPEEEIVFANKEVLYRKEEKVRVISMQWWKIAVAAAVILVAGVGTFTVLTKKDNSTTIDVATNNDPVQQPGAPAADEKGPADELKNNTEAPSIEKSIQDNVASVTTNDAIQTKTRAGKKQQEEKSQITKSAPQNFTNNKDEILAKTEPPVKKENTTSTITDNNIKAVDTRLTPSTTDASVDVKNTIAAVDKNASKQNSNNDAVTNNPDNTSDIKEVHQQEFDDVYASNNESKNKKLRGFFRKATRVFEKRTNISATDDSEEKILIGALAVKLK